MATHGDFVIDVVDFQRDVIVRSQTVPVLVDFWAPWCRPCLMLGPVLEKLAEEFAGAFILAKLNTDENQVDAQRYGVRGIPDVKLFRDGEVQDGFVGALPEAQVRAFLQKHCPSEAQTLVQEGLQLLENGDGEAAGVALARAVSLDATLDAAHFGLARVALANREYETVQQHLDRLSRLADERDRATHLLAMVALIRDALAVGTEEQLRARLQSDPDDVEARFAIGGHELANHQYRSALEAYLGVAERQPSWRDQTPRKAMVTVFGVVGMRHPMANEFREKLIFIY